jgi:hypothetical protein
MVVGGNRLGAGFIVETEKDMQMEVWWREKETWDEPASRFQFLLKEFQVKFNKGV